jgi:hypothetical protein
MAGSASSSKRVWRSSLFAAVVLSACAAACGRGRAQTSRTDAAIDASVAGAKSPANEEPPREAGTADASAAYASAAPISGKSVGHTSVVFKLGLEGGATVAYKPRSTRGDHRYRGEIAAYRLARALSLSNVPLAMPRSFEYAALQTAVGREPIFGEVVKEPDGSVRGALIPWIKGLEFIPLQNDEWLPKWRSWLRTGGAIPNDQRDLAAQISDLLAFDQVTGNWDRWSGGNIGIDHTRGMLLFVDNDGAFFDPVPVKEMKWPTSLFEGVDRFSRRFVAALRTLDVASAVGEEAPGESFLSSRVLAQTEARRKHVLAFIDAKIARLGEPAVLAFE